MAEEANGCLGRSHLRASDQSPCVRAIVFNEICFTGSSFGAYLLRKDGFELQCLLMATGKSPNQYFRSFQIFSGQFVLSFHFLIFLTYPDKPLGMNGKSQSLLPAFWLRQMCPFILQSAEHHRSSRVGRGQML